MSEFQCRTCLAISDKKSSFPLNHFLLGKTIKDIILPFIPNMESSVLIQENICDTCFQILNTFSQFIERCREVEMVLKRINSELIGDKMLDLNNAHISNQDESNIDSRQPLLKLVTGKDLSELKDHSYFSTKESIDAPKLIYVYTTPTNAVIPAVKPNGVPNSPENEIVIIDSDDENTESIEPEICSSPEGETYQINNIGSDSSFQVPTFEYADQHDMPSHDRVLCVPQPTENFPQLLTDFVENAVDVFQVVLPLTNLKSIDKKRLLLFGSAIIRCSECRTEFETHSELRMHYANNHKEKLPLADPEKEMFDNIIMKKRQKVAHFCPHCEKDFVSMRSLTQHLKETHKDYVPYKCVTCGKKFRVKQNYDVHLRTASLFGSCNYKKCNKCSEMIEKAKYLEHRKTHTNFICEECGKSFMCNAHLERHRASHQGKTSEMNLCPICGKLTNKHYYSHHLQTHDKSGKFMCDRCPKIFRTRVQLHQHLSNIHYKTKQYVCSECNKKCSTSSALRGHKRLKHWRDHTHSCHICGERFVRGDYYKRHMKRHLTSGEPSNRGPRRGLSDRSNGVRVYKKSKFYSAKCKFCSKLFKDVYLLRLHVLASHVKKKRFKCRHCDFTFSNMNNRLRHEKRHKDPNFELSCKICWKRMETREELDVHCAKHDMNRKYQCVQCGELLPSKYHLKHHMAEKHISDEDVEKEKSVVLKNALEEFFIVQ